MKKIIEKRNYIIWAIVIILLIFITLQIFNNKYEYSKSYNYFDHHIVVKIYENKDVFSDIDKIYKKYEKAINGHNDKLLNKIINYGKEIYKNTDGYVDISKGKLTSGQVDHFTTKINELSAKMKDDIDASSIIGGYATNEVVNYLKKNNIDKYLISDDGDITAGTYYTNGKYKVSISDADNSKILAIASLENKSMVTRRSDDKIKSYMVNPIESKVTKKYDTIIVVSDNVNVATMLADALYLMDRQDGKALVKKYDASAFWYVDGKTYTFNFDKYTKD